MIVFSDVILKMKRLKNVGLIMSIALPVTNPTFSYFSEYRALIGRRKIGKKYKQLEEIKEKIKFAEKTRENLGGRAITK